MTRTIDVVRIASRERLLSAAMFAGVFVLLSTVLPRPVSAATITAQGAVTALTDVNQT